MDSMMQDAHILILGAIILLFSAVYMHAANRIFDLSFISIPSVWYFAYAIIIFIPAFWTFYGRGGHYRFNYIYAIASPLMTVPLGILFINVLLKYKPQEMQQYHLSAIEDQPKSFVRILNYSLVLMIGLALFCSWCIEQDGPIPLLYLLSPGEKTQNLGVMREYSFKLLDSPIRYLYHLTRDFLFPLLTLVAFGNYYYSRSRVWLFFLILSCGVGLFYAGANISKTSFFSIVLLLLLNLFILKGVKLNWKQMMFGIFLSLSFPVFVLMSVFGDFSWQGFLLALQKMMERIFVAPSSILYYGFEIIPDRYPFQMGRLMGPLAYLFGKEPSDLAQYAAWYIMGEDYATTSVAGAFVTQLFGDFGFPGVIFGGILVGMAMQWIHVSIIRKPKTVFAIATYVLFIYFFSTLTYLQIASALILSGAPILWLLYKTKLLG